MRKVVAYELLSLDGVAEDPNEFITEWDDVMDENLGRVIGKQDAVLLGRRTYDEWALFWPPSDIEPFASFINNVQKYVVTSSVPDIPWTNSTVFDSDFIKKVLELKNQTGGDIGVHGSVALVKGLLASGLIDELSLVVAPALHGRGRLLFDEGISTRMTLTRSVVSPSGYLLLDYALTN
jgi:dihydrofolate reductase